MRSKVAVVIPTHNRCDLLAVTLHNVRATQECDFTVAVVDDGSTDATPAILEEIARIDRRFSVHRFDTPRGACAARNFGLANTDSEYVCFLDADDLLHPDKLAFQSKLLDENPDLDAVVCQMAHFENDPREATLLWNTFQGPPLAERFLGHDPVWGMHGSLWRRQYLQKLGGFDETLPMAQDFDLHGRAVLSGANIMLHADLLTYCRRHLGGSISSSKRLARLSTIGRVLTKFEATGELTKAQKTTLAGTRLWIANLAALEGDRAVMRDNLMDARRLGAAGTNFALFRLLCMASRLTKRHRFYALARKCARRMGHDLSTRESWYSSHTIVDEPGLVPHAMPESSWKLER